VVVKAPGIIFMAPLRLEMSGGLLYIAVPDWLVPSANP